MNQASTYQTYLINLDRSKERLKKMQTAFEQQNITDFKRISAVDGKSIDNDSYIVDNQYKAKLLSGEIGCWLSHYNTLKIFLQSNYAFAIIIEDDAVLKQDYKYYTEKAIATYDRLKEEEQWDVLKLKNKKRKHIAIKSIDDTHFIAACGLSIPITTIAAIWTRKAAQKFIDKTTKNGLPIIKRPIDCELQHPWEYDLRIYNLLPSIVASAKFKSEININQVRRKNKKKTLQKVFYELKRFFPKYKYYISHHGLKKFLSNFIFSNDTIIE